MEVCFWLKTTFSVRLSFRTSTSRPGTLTSTSRFWPKAQSRNAVSCLARCASSIAHPQWLTLPHFFCSWRWPCPRVGPASTIFPVWLRWNKVGSARRRGWRNFVKKKKGQNGQKWRFWVFFFCVFFSPPNSGGKRCQPSWIGAFFTCVLGYQPSFSCKLAPSPRGVQPEPFPSRPVDSPNKLIKKTPRPKIARRSV